MDPQHYEMSEKEILIKMMKQNNEIIHRLEKMITLFYIFYVGPMILAFVLFRYLLK